VRSFPETSRAAFEPAAATFHMKSLTYFFAFAALAVNGVSADNPTDASSPPLATNADYRLSPRDLVQFQVYNQPDMTTAQRVTTNGELRFPLIGTVNVSGQTLRQAELLLEKQLKERGFFVNPQVILAVEQYAERYVSVLGQVNSPERIPMSVETKSLGILQAITQAGGFTRVSRTDEVQVLRINSDGKEERITVNVDELLKSKSAGSRPEFQLTAGDVVFVPERVF
jgi:polysaccharide export outer membrane protein